MNLYNTLGAVKSVLGLTGTTYDTRILIHLEDASRRIDAFCNRVFYTRDGTRYFDGRHGVRVYTDDFLSVTSVTTDSELDNTFDGETWVDGTDFVAWPDNSYPKLGLHALPDGNYSWLDAERYVKMTGTWGYGDGRRSSPWDSLTATATVADTTTTTLTLSSDTGEVSPGQTLLCEDEQLYVTAVSTVTVTVERGVNGTTAAAHTAGSALSKARYPIAVEMAVVHVAINLMARAPKAGFKSERIGDYSYTLATEADEAEFLGRALRGLVRIA